MIEQIVFEKLEDGDVINGNLCVSACHDVLCLTETGVGPLSSCLMASLQVARLGWVQTTCILRQSQPQFLQTLTQSGGQPRSQSEALPASGTNQSPVKCRFAKLVVGTFT